MFLHTGERPYRCQSCQSSFTARDRLKGHILKHHPDHPAAQELVQQSKQNAAAEINEPPPKRRKRKSSRQLTEKITESSDNNNSRVTNFIVQWPATLQVGADGNLCWQAPATFDPAGGSFNEVSTVQPQIIIQQDQVLPNPLDVAIKEIIEVDQGSRFGGDKLSAVESVPKEESVFICDKCGREYKYKSFLQVHQKRKCW